MYNNIFSTHEQPTKKQNSIQGLFAKIEALRKKIECCPLTVKAEEFQYFAVTGTSTEAAGTVRMGIEGSQLVIQVLQADLITWNTIAFWNL